MQQDRKNERELPKAPGETLDARKERARVWFEHLRDDICVVLEAIEEKAAEGKAPARFVRTPWTRQDPDEEGGGGVMALLSGGSYSRKSAATSRPCMATSRRNSPSKFLAPRKTRASGPPASLSSRTR